MTPQPPPITLPPTTGPTTTRATTTRSTTGPADSPSHGQPALPTVPTLTVFAMIGFWLLVACGGALLARATAWRGTPRAETTADDSSRGEPLVLWLGAAILFLAQGIFGAAIVPKLQHRFASTGLLDEVMMVGVAGMYVAGLAAVAVLHVATGRRSLVAIGAGRGPSSLDVTRALTAAIVAIPATNAALALTQWMWERLSYSHESVHQLLQLMGRDRQSPAVLILTIVVAVVLAPLFEEVMFRGHIQSALQRALPGMRWLPILITSLLFAAMHEAWMMPPIFVLSLALGYVYQRSRSLWVSTLLHMTFNGVSTAIYLLSQG